jgi:hypothetical protein
LVQILSDRRQKTEIKSSNNTQNFCSNWGKIKHGVPRGSILGPLLFIKYIKDLPPTISTLTESIFADDTSVTISSKKFGDVHRTSNILLSQISKWFSAKKLVLNLHKTNIIKFIMKNLPQHTLHIGYKEKYVEESINTTFLGLQTDRHIN